METTALLPILRSRLQGELLALLMLHPDKEYSLTDIARLTGATVRAVHTEVNRLSTAGLVKERRVGIARLVRAATDTVLTGPLTALLEVTFGAIPVLRDALAQLSGIDWAFIYGSWAARYHGEQGRPPADVDVMVIGDVDPDVLDDVARDTEQAIHRQVNMRRVTSAAWRAAQAEPFVQQVMLSPRVDLIGQEIGR